MPGWICGFAAWCTYTSKIGCFKTGAYFKTGCKVPQPCTDVLTVVLAMLMDCSGHQRRQWCSGRLHVRQQLQPQHFMPSRGRMGEPSQPPPLAGETQEAFAKGPTTIQVPHIHIWLRSRPQGNMARVVGKGCHEACPREQLHRHGSQSPPANRYLFSVVLLSSR